MKMRLEPKNNEPFDFLNWKVNLQTYQPERKYVPRNRLQSEWRAERLSEIWDILNEIQKMYEPYKDSVSTQLWYRGQTDSNYVLLPSLIRTYFDKSLTCPLPQYQRLLFEQYLARSKVATELTSYHTQGLHNGNIEHIANMQHYSIPTNLMDWSEDITTALYFATEKTQTRMTEEVDAAIYVMHPVLYNLVRNEIIKLYQENNNNQLQKKNHETTKQMVGPFLPNLCAEFNLNATQYEDFVFGPSDFVPLATYKRGDPFEKRKVQNANPFIQEESPLLPLAITMARNNPRIINQKGTFLAFNLCELPSSDDLRPPLWGMDHIELSNIQKFYIDISNLPEKKAKQDSIIYNPMASKVPFLHKIVISSFLVPRARKMMEMFGKKNSTMYPELYRMGEEITSKILPTIQ